MFYVSIESFMEILILCWISISFLYGLFLWLTSCFKNSDVLSSIKIVDVTLNKFLLVCFGFFLVPFITQQFICYFFREVPISINQTLFITFISELVLLSFVVGIIMPLVKPIESFNASIRVFKNVYDGYCKVLPIVVLTASFWEYILKILVLLGFKITIDLQPIIQLLVKNDINTITAMTLFISVVILAPICEEIFFRGFFLRYLCKFFSLRKSLWISAIVFACAHQHLATFLPLMFLGYWLGFTYAKTGNILVNIGIHSLFNGTNFILIFLFKTYDF